MIKYISVDDFIDHQIPHLQHLMQRLRILILNAHPRIREHLEINTPMFKVKQDVCYFGKVHPTKGLELCFLRGFQLSNEQGLLDAKGRRYIHGITLTDINDLKNKETAFLEVLNEALILDEINEKSVFTEMLQAARKKKST
ncbi:DUF1801 domain-containing protein [Emticicia sp. C21]|uniref:DUF1801 domain-containing protein n=1 Tax=Emticicia sp. C21 TaxID=2302915 RepID=UPI000E34C017|nr:DUF1801 domain-containing protein [Emticicia sp. C21]RFS14096.1 hypothetical protein D0T08_22870 [Emticicia sp. C21]